MTQSHTPVLEAVVLAAGRGARFGGAKLLAELDGAPLVARALATAFAAPVRQVFVTVGDDPRLVAALKAAADGLGAGDRLVLVSAPHATEGMGVSLGAAVKAMPADSQGVFVFLGDMPAIAAETPAHLAAMLDRADRVIAPVHAGRRGHPVLFGAAWLPALRALNGDEGARRLLAEAGPRLIAVAVDDPGVLLDVDSREDLARLTAPTEPAAPDRRGFP